jgi:hypothetical protein
MTTITDFDATFVNLVSGISIKINEGVQYNPVNTNTKHHDIFKILSNPEQTIVPFLLKNEKVEPYNKDKDIDMVHDDLSGNSYCVKSINKETYNN